MRKSDRKVSTAGLSAQPDVAAQPAGWRQLWQMHVQSCLRRDLSNQITINQFRELSERSCSYCGGSPLLRDYTRSGNIHANGIDRVDSKLGYIEGNLVPACGICNRMKTGMTADEFKQHAAKIASHRK
jgi:hypothetical protein